MEKQPFVGKLPRLNDAASVSRLFFSHSSRVRQAVVPPVVPSGSVVWPSSGGEAASGLALDGVDGAFEVECGVVGADEIEIIVVGDAVVFFAVGPGVGTKEIDGLDDRCHVGTWECV